MPDSNNGNTTSSRTPAQGPKNCVDSAQGTEKDPLSFVQGTNKKTKQGLMHLDLQEMGFKEGLDVISGRGEQAKRINEHYRSLIRQFYPAYINSSSPALRRMLGEEITKIIESAGGRFFDEECQEMSHQQSRVKVMKALKDFKKQDPARRSAKKTKKRAAKTKKEALDQPLNPPPSPPPPAPEVPVWGHAAPTLADWARDSVPPITAAQPAVVAPARTPSFPRDDIDAHLAVWLTENGPLPERTPSSSVLRNTSLDSLLASMPFPPSRNSSLLEPLVMKTPSREFSDLARMTDSEMKMLQVLSSTS